MGGQSGSWTPTKRRGPIAAEFQGPGPAALSLPALFGSEFLLFTFFGSQKYRTCTCNLCLHLEPYIYNKSISLQFEIQGL